MKSDASVAPVPMWRVVIIEDSPEDRDELRRLLLKGSDRRYQFVEAQTGAAGVRAVLEDPDGPPDCVLLDYTLPDTDALEVLPAVIGPDGLTICPFVVVTGIADMRLGPAVLRAGAQDFIGKDWMTAESLTRAIENAAERWAMTRELQARAAALKAGQHQLQLAVELAGLGVTRIDYCTNTVVLDSIAAELFGLEAGVPLPRSAIHDTFHPDDAAEISRLMNHSLDPAGDGCFVMEHRVVHGDGSIRWQSVKKQVVFGDVGGVRGPVAGILAAVDITERKAAERELARHREDLQREVETRTAELAASTVALHTSERLAALGTLAAGLGHDIANLTMPIRTRLELLNAACTTDGAREDLAAIREALDHLSNLSAGMRLMAIDPERGEASPPAADLKLWCVETSQIFRAALPRQIQLKCDVPGGLGVNIPRHWLAQAVFNLVQNAGEAMAARPAGTVRVTAEAATSDAGAPVVKVQVSDDGPGMSAEVVARCFEPYFSTKGRAICTGMGLGMVRGIVDSAGGTVAVRSVPGEGTTFTLTLPAVVSGQAAHANAALMAAVTVKSQREAALAMMFLGQLKVRTSRHLEPSVPEVSLWVVERPDPALLRAYLGHDRERRVVVLDRGFDSAASDTGGQKPWDGKGLNDLNARMTVLSPSPSPGELRNAITQAIRASAPTALGT